MNTTDTSITYVTVILPLAVPKTYSYIVPEDLVEDVAFGKRVEVPLRSKLYSAIIVDVSINLELDYKARKIRSVIDKSPIISERQFDFWRWLASYYCCSIGEVMGVALPAGLKLSSETKVIASPHFDEDYEGLSDEEFMIAEAISIQNELTIDQVRDILDRKTVYPFIRNLLDKRVIYIKEELQTKYKPKKVGFVTLADHYKDSRENLSTAFTLIERSEKQTNALLAYVQLSRTSFDVPKSAIYEMTDVDNAVLRALEKKGILKIFQKEISRLTVAEGQESVSDIPPMSSVQEFAYNEIKTGFESKDHILLHGVTGSGKTRIYIELIREALAEGKQVLYLLPEIALTTQIVSRLMAVFGEDIGVYHSRMNNNNRVELWKAVYEGKSLILGARSSLFLPYRNLGLIVIDEEHDPSYKQNDPNPRYNARDAAIYMAGLYNAQVILGSATPSLETYYNARRQKYGYVPLSKRHGEVALPKIEIVDLKYARKTGRMKSVFSLTLRDTITNALNRKEQVLIFQNRRGFAPVVQCHVCGWSSDCPNCDVTLTFHKFTQELKCHYCGHRKRNPDSCPACGNDDLTLQGMGTQKIEDEISELYPEARVARMDFDTVKTKNAFEQIIYDFENRQIDILVGTQMITKGLDFDNISLVGVLNADLLMQFPDFRAGERAFQLLTQVAGRAGRRKTQGLVIVQTYSPSHPVIREMLSADYKGFYARESRERKRFIYPPFYRMIHIQLKHKKANIVEEAAKAYVYLIKKTLGNRVVGPAAPGIARLRGLYLQNVIIKMEKDAKVIRKAKEILLSARSEIRKAAGFKSVRINVDVDPY